jgi:hypothetical protein
LWYSKNQKLSLERSGKKGRREEKVERTKEEKGSVARIKLLISFL